MIVRALHDSDRPALRAAILAKAPTAATPVLLSVLDQLPAQLADGSAAAAVAALQHQAGDTTGYPAQAFVALHLSERQATLAGVWVVPELRRRGLARALLAFCRPLWQDTRVVATLPAEIDPAPVAALLGQFGLAPERDGTTWATRAVRRTAGRSSLAPVPRWSRRSDR